MESVFQSNMPCQEFQPFHIRTRRVSPRRSELERTLADSTLCAASQQQGHGLSSPQLKTFKNIFNHFRIIEYQEKVMLRRICAAFRSARTDWSLRPGEALNFFNDQRFVFVTPAAVEKILRGVFNVGHRNAKTLALIIDLPIPGVEADEPDGGAFRQTVWQRISTRAVFRLHQHSGSRLYRARHHAGTIRAGHRQLQSNRKPRPGGCTNEQRAILSGGGASMADRPGQNTCATSGR
jgi:hypothetical protein